MTAPLIDRSRLFDLMGELKLYGMRGAYDEVMAHALKRQHEPPRILGDLLGAEIAEKQARSIKYQLAIAKLPLAKDLADFDFAGTPFDAGNGCTLILACRNEAKARAAIEALEVLLQKLHDQVDDDLPERAGSAASSASPCRNSGIA